MKRKLLEASIYRMFLFESQAELDRYMVSGHRERWIIDKYVNNGGNIVAVIGETYNDCDKLILSVKEDE